MRKKMKWMSLLVTTVFLIAAASPVYAQTDAGTDDPAPTEEENTDFLDNPIVKLLSSFFSGLFEPEPTPEPTEDPGTPGDPEATPDPDGEGGDEGGEPGEGEDPTPEPTAVPALSPEEEVAAMHADDDLGFGEIVKLLQISAESEIACSTEGINCDVTIDSLIDEYKSGVGMGDLYETYGKPSMTGVGQVRKAEATPNPNANENSYKYTVEEKVKSNNGKAKGKDK